MAGYRQFHTQFWKDEWLIDLDPLERYLFIYLFTNDLSSISGIYKLPLRVILNETGLDLDFVTATLEKFQRAQKIFYRDGVMWVVNMRRYHKNASPRTMTKVNADVSQIPDCDVKTSYLYHEKTGIYSIDTVSIPRSEILSVSVIESVSESAAADPFEKPEIAIIREVTGGRVPDYLNEAMVINNVQTCRSRLRFPPVEMLKTELESAYKDWCATPRKEGGFYNPGNWQWTEWAATGYRPVKPSPNGKPKRVLTGANGEQIEVEA